MRKNFLRKTISEMSPKEITGCIVLFLILGWFSFLLYSAFEMAPFILLALAALFFAVFTMVKTITLKKSFEDVSAMFFLPIMIILLQIFLDTDSPAIIVFPLSIGLGIGMLISNKIVQGVEKQRKQAAIKEQNQKQPEAPKKSGLDMNKIHPAYRKDLQTMKQYQKNLASRKETVSVFLDEFFAGSSISKSRYLQTISNAEHVLKVNNDKATQAALLFGQSQPTQERIDIIHAYAADSQEVMDKIEKVIDELIKVQQSDTIRSGDSLDGLLDDLASTTAYYQSQPSH